MSLRPHIRALSASRPRPRRVTSVTAALLIAFAAGTPPGATAQAEDGPPSTRPHDGRDLPVRTHVLDNGMTFLLLPREGAPTVSFVLHVGVGSVHETLGGTGTAHVLEHLLFKGTTSIGTRNVEAERELFARMDATHDSLLQARGILSDPDPETLERLESRIRSLADSARTHVVANEYQQILSRHGARGLNATTGYEATQYFVNLPANRIQLWFILEADRMRNPVFREFYAERDVVAEERRTRVSSSPSGRLYEAYMAAAFAVHPYGVHPIGHMDDIQSLSRPAVEAFHRRHYRPDNVTVAVVGDFDADSATAWADRYFSPLETRDPPTPVLVREPEQRGERRVEVRYDAEPQLRIGWKVPAGIRPEAPALSMLANILAGGRDSRLHRRLVREEGIATAVSAGPGPGTLFPGLFTIQAVPRAPHDAEEIEAVIYEELHRLRTEAPPTADELERVRIRLEASRVRQLVSNQGLAFQLVDSHATRGDWRETFTLQARIQAVEAEDITTLLERHFHEDGRTVAILRRGRGADR